MPITIANKPASFHYSRDEAWVFFTSSDGPTTSAILRIEVKASLVVDDTITISWGGVDYLFTASSTPTIDGLSLPLQAAGDTIQQYADAIVLALRRNADLTAAFDISQTISTGSTAEVRLEAKTINVIDLSFASSNVPALDVLSLANPDLDLPVPSALIECYNITGLNRASLGRRQSPIDALRTTYFDLSESISLEAIIPPSALLNAGFDMRQIAGNVLRYELRYALQLGTPPVAEAMVQYQSATSERDIVAIHGRSPAFGYNPLDAQTPANNIYVLNAVIEREEVLPSQPVFRYLVATGPVIGNDLSLRITVYKSTSNLAIVTTQSLGTISIARGDSYVVGVGFYQLLLDQEVDFEDITHYSVELVTNSVSIDLGTFMVKHECPDYRATLLFDNQLGGCDTLVLEGDQVWSNPTVVSPVRTGATFSARPQYTEGTRRGDHVVVGNTGYVSKTRAQHISTALPARAWILSGGTWLPGYLQKTNDVYLDTSSSLASVPLEFTLAAPQR